MFSFFRGNTDIGVVGARKTAGNPLNSGIHPYGMRCMMLNTMREKRLNKVPRHGVKRANLVEKVNVFSFTGLFERRNLRLI